MGSKCFYPCALRLVQAYPVFPRTLSSTTAPLLSDHLHSVGHPSTRLNASINAFLLKCFNCLVTKIFGDLSINFLTQNTE